MQPVIYASFDEVLDLTARDGRRGQLILDVGEEVRRRYPQAWANAHNGDPESGSEFVRRWAMALRAIGIFAGINGKRGGQEPSQDILTFPVHQGGNRDTSGRFPAIVIADVIGGAGGPSPSLTLHDVSAPSQGRFLDPWGVDHVDIPGLPPGDPPVLPPAPAPMPGPAPVPPAALDPRAVAEAVVTLLGPRLDALDGRVEHIIHAMFGPLATPTLLEHIDDVKRVQLGLPRDDKFL